MAAHEMSKVGFLSGRREGSERVRSETKDGDPNLPKWANSAKCPWGGGCISLCWLSSQGALRPRTQTLLAPSCSASNKFLAPRPPLVLCLTPGSQRRQWHAPLGSSSDGVPGSRHRRCEGTEKRCQTHICTVRGGAQGLVGRTS